MTISAVSTSLATAPAQARRAPGPNAVLYVTVKNPHCPACLKTLKGYLLQMSEVEAVHIGGYSGRAVKLTIELTKTRGRTASGEKVIDRIKAHDLAVLSTH